MNSGEQPTDETQSAPVQESQSSGTSVPANSPSIGKKSKAPLPRLGPGPLSARGPLAARGLGVAKPASPAVSTEQLESQSQKKHSKPKNSGPKPKIESPVPGVVPGTISSPALTVPPTPSISPLSSIKPGDSDDAFDPRISAQQPTQKNSGDKSKQHPRPRLSGEKAAAEDKFEPVRAAKIPVPNVRQGLSEDLEAELQASLAGSDLDSFFQSSAGLPARRQPLEEGARVHAQVIKMHDDSVYVALGGPDQGVVPAEHFVNAEPTPGMSIEVLVRGISREDGLYSCVLPNQALEVSDWDDIEEGSIVEAVVTGHNTGGLECKVGNVRAFMPISQVTEFRVEDLSEFVDQKMVCVVTEANERRGNLVLSRRAILERERKEKRDAQLEQIEAGDILEGTVRTVRDFGAFVDLGGLDGLIHVSKLSWERIKHPKDVIQEGQRVKVKIESIDKQTGKISLSYRDLLENPWDAAVASFAPGSIHKGTVTKVAAFGCFVRLATGVEGLVHISELANHRVSKVGAFVNEGDSVDVKVLTFDRESQKIALSMKAAVAKPVDAPEETTEETDEPPREMAVKAYAGPLRGGNERESGGERFGLRW